MMIELVSPIDTRVGPTGGMCLGLGVYASRSWWIPSVPTLVLLTGGEKIILLEGSIDIPDVLLVMCPGSIIGWVPSGVNPKNSGFVPHFRKVP